jgi:glycerophosphoryl diester phosphodiesterase
MFRLFALSLALLCPALTFAQEPIRVLVRTDLGNIELELDARRAPITVANFLRYLDAGFYERGLFHRTVHPENQPENKVRIQVIQASVAEALQMKSFPPIKLERTSATGLKHLDGSVSMARDGPDTAQGDFFICLGPQPELDFGGKRNPDGQGFAAFGRVVRGMDVVKKINAAPEKMQKLTPPIGILSAKRLTSPKLVAHRGLSSDAPENTLSAFRACLNLRFSCELDVRRTKDGTLVVLHDADLKRTTSGEGSISAIDLADLVKLDAGSWFEGSFRGERVPTLDSVFALIKEQGHAETLVAVDLKIEDDKVEAEVVELAKKHGILDRILCIGTAISSSKVRQRLRRADAKTPVAMLAQTAKDLPAALADTMSDWVYVRFVPSEEDVKRIRAAKKRVIVVGPMVMGKEPSNWVKVREAGVDAMLTDWPTEARREWRGK